MNFFDKFWPLRIYIIAVGVAVFIAIRKQKPWWKLTSEEKKKQLPYLIAGLIMVFLGIITFILFSTT